MNNNINTRNNVVRGLEGYMYFWDQGFDQNTMRMGKCEISWPETEIIWLLRKKWDLQKYYLSMERRSF